MYKIGVIGGGNMGEAIIAGSRGRFSVLVNEKDKKRQAYLRRNYKIRSHSFSEVGRKADAVILAVKPQDIEEALKGLKAVLKKNTLVISIAAGITSRFIERKLRVKTRVIRTMPNMPALIGEGITAVSRGRFAKASDVKAACRILGALGKTVIVNEKLIDAVTAVSGSGPAYVFLFMEHLIRAAEKAGLAKNLAQELVMATFKGSVNLVLKKNIEPAVLRAKVTSKGGTTQAALKVFDKKNFGKMILDAVSAAKKRAKQLSKG